MAISGLGRELERDIKMGGLGGEELGDGFVEEFGVGGVAGGAGGVAPEGGDGFEGDGGHEGGFVFGVGEGEVEVGFGGHVEEGDFDGAEGGFDVVIEGGSAADVVLFPGAALEDEVVRVGAGNEVVSESVQYLFEGGVGCGCCFP